MSHRTIAPPLALALSLSIALAAPARGQCGAHPQIKSVPSDGVSDDRAGMSVAIDGFVAVVGAPRDDDGGSASGSAYVYRFDGIDWVEEAKLTADDAAAGDEFGSAVAVSYNRVVVGAWHDDDFGSNSGAAYVFQYNGASWNQIAKLLPPDGAAGDVFGSCVAVELDLIAVGAPRHDAAASDGGAVYVFRKSDDQWSLSQKLMAGDSGLLQLYGSAVAINAGAVAVGAPQDDEHAGNAGALYVYRPAGVNLVANAKLAAFDASSNDKFGTSVSFNGAFLATGAIGDSDGGFSSGSVYVFRFDGENWDSGQKLVADDPASTDSFGESLALSGDTLLIGSPFDDDGGSNSGSVYVFRYDGWNWTQNAKLIALDAGASDSFGRSLAGCGARAIVGAPFDDDRGASSGAAYFVGNLVDCNANGLFDICDLASGTSGDLNGDGRPDECCPGDFNSDGMVNLTDLAIVLANFGSTSAGWGQGDADGDGHVDLLDLQEMLVHYETSCN